MQCVAERLGIFGELKWERQRAHGPSQFISVLHIMCLSCWMKFWVFDGHWIEVEYLMRQELCVCPKSERCQQLNWNNGFTSHSVSIDALYSYICWLTLKPFTPPNENYNLLYANVFFFRASSMVSRIHGIWSVKSFIFFVSKTRATEN